MVLAGINMLVFHAATQRSVKQWDEDAFPPLGAKVAGGLSILCWLGVIAAGRWIGFSDF